MTAVLQDGAQLVVRGGWLMIPIFICSIISVAIIIEKFFFFVRFKKFRTPQLLRDIFTLLQKKDIKGAVAVCEKNQYYLTNILKAALYRYHKPKEVIRESMELASLYEIPLLEKHLNVLGTLAHISPLLGLLGTVVGLVKSFYVIEQKASSVGMINPSDIAGGIWEALLTTVAGLGIAIISYLAYNYFAHKANMCILEAEKASTELFEVMVEEA